MRPVLNDRLTIRIVALDYRGYFKRATILRVVDNSWLCQWQPNRDRRAAATSGTPELGRTHAIFSTASIMEEGS